MEKVNRYLIRFKYPSGDRGWVTLDAKDIDDAKVKFMKGEDDPRGVKIHISLMEG